MRDDKEVRALNAPEGNGASTNGASVNGNGSGVPERMMVYPSFAYSNEEEQEEPSVPLSHYLWIVRRRAWEILAFIAVSVIATVIVSARLTPKYESTATIDIDRQEPSTVIGQDSNRTAALNDSDQFLATQLKLIVSDSVLRPVVQRFKIPAKDIEDRPEDKSTAQAQEDFTQKMCSPEFREKVLPEIRPWCVEFFRQLYAHAMEAAWPEVIVTPFDEPAKYARSPHKRNPDELGSGPWIKPQFMENCAIIREGAPKLKIYASIHHNKADEGIVFLPDVDIFCANCIQEDPALGDKVRAGGKTFWQYSGVNNLPASARYGFGFYFASFDSRGSLCWAYNWGSRFDTASGGETWIYAWQTPFDTIPAPYFEGMREAWDDRRIVETYKKTFAGDPAALGELAKVLDAARASYSAGGQDTVTDFWERMDRPEKLDGWRNQLLDRLVKGKP